MTNYDSLPAYELITGGIDDLKNQRETIRIAGRIGAPKLRILGIELPCDLPINPEHRLYDLLSATDSDSAHSRYNSLLRRLVSFNRALQVIRNSSEK